MPLLRAFCVYYAFLSRVSKGGKDSELRVNEWSWEHAWQPNVISLCYNPQGYAMAPSKKKKVVIARPDMPVFVPAECHIRKGDVKEGAEQGEDGAWENCESLDPELERLLAGHCVEEDQSVEVGTFNYIKCGMSTNVQTREKRVLFWYGMLIIPKK